MKHLTNTIKDTYYRFNPGEFFPVYAGGVLTNKREFHAYRLKWLLKNRAVFWYQLTHNQG
jgi:hypothetical protein